MRHTTVSGHLRPLLVALVAVLTVAAGCSAGEEDSSPGGWIDGSPAEADAAGGRSGRDESSSAVAEDGRAAASSAGSSTTDASDAAAPERVEAAAGLRAGSVDDNEDFSGYLTYRDRAGGLGVTSRPLDVSVRHVVEVRGRDGRPVLGEPVQVVAGDEVVGSVRTGTDGRSYVHPRAMGVADGTPVTLRVAGVDRDPAPDGPTAFALERSGGATAPVPLDLFFVLDATGSMADELDRLTATVDSVVARISGLEGEPDVRLGMTVYRDEGDAFLTRTFDFTDDVDAFRSALGEVTADGGGDDPEAMDEALAAAIDEPAWRDPGEAVQVAFVVADAPPQVGRNVPTPYDRSLQEAAARGIRIHSVGASGSSDEAEYALRPARPVHRWALRVPELRGGRRRPRPRHRHRQRRLRGAAA